MSNSLWSDKAARKFLSLALAMSTVASCCTMQSLAVEVVGNGAKTSVSTSGDIPSSGSTDPIPVNPSDGKDTDESGSTSGTPGTEQPGTEQPGTEKPGTEKPGTEQPGTEKPGTEKPGTEQPGTEKPGTETPGTETPGTETPSYPSELNITANVKDGATDDSIRTGLTSLIKSENPELPISKIEYPSSILSYSTFDAAVTYDNGTNADCHVVINKVSPEGLALRWTPDTLKSNNAENKSSSTLLAYVNSDLSLVYTGDAFNNAIGEVKDSGKIKAFAWKNCDKKYETTGGTYTFTQEYNGVTFTRVVTVESSNYSIGSVKIDYDNNTVTTTSKMQWSFMSGKEAWSKCSDNMKIPATWYGNTVYFKVPADAYSTGSEIVSLKIPEKAVKPTAQPKLKSTSHSVTITNLWDFDYCEFRIDDGSWETSKKETYTFDNLKANTQYKVEVRSRAEVGELLASDVVTASIKTAETLQTSVAVTNGSHGNTGTVNASAIIEPDVHGKSIRGELDERQLNKFSNIIDEYVGRYSKVESSLSISHKTEAGEVSDITSTSFTLPLRSIGRAITSGNLELNYLGELCDIYIGNSGLKDIYNRSSGTLSISVEKPTSFYSGSSSKWLKDAYNGGADIYKVSVSSGNRTGDVEYSLPYELSGNDTVSEINVYFVNSKGDKSNLNFTYDGAAGRIKTTTDESGYIVVYADGVRSDTLPFKDVPSNFWATKYIQYCYNRGLFVGTSATTFSPSGNINKAQITALIARFADYKLSEKSSANFSDVKQTDWYYEYAKWAVENKIVTGKEFNGAEPVQRQEIARMIYAYLQSDGKVDKKADLKSVKDYSDNKSISSNCKTAIQYLRYLGIMEGTGNNKFTPESYVNRAQMAAIMYRLSTIVG